MQLNFQQPVALVMLAIGAFKLTHMILAIRKMKQAKTWPHTDGVITEVKTRGEWCWAGNGKTWIEKPVISYEYEVDGLKLIGHNLALAQTNSASKTDANQKIRDLKVGEQVIVYFDPADPGTSTLDVSFKMEPPLLFAFVSLLPILLALLLLADVLRLD